MNIFRYDQESSDGLVRCLYIDINDFRMLFALSESVWYTKGKERRIPVFMNKKGLFIYKLGIRLGFRRYRRVKHE